MSRKSKWISGIPANVAVSDAARQVIDQRLGPVLEYLPLAAHQSDESIEYVHQLRVSVRRAMAAIEVFESLLPSKQARWIKKKLKHIRRAAGDARDNDVLQLRLADVSDQLAPKAWKSLRKRLERERRAAQQPIIEVEQKTFRPQTHDRFNGLTAKLRWKPVSKKSGGTDVEPTFVDLARSDLRTFVDDLFAAAGQDLTDPHALHEMRIVGKALRYGLEIFADVLEPSVRAELYPQVEELQELLGQVNDHQVAQVRFAKWSDDSADKQLTAFYRQLQVTEQAAYEDSRRESLEWWSQNHEQLKLGLYGALDPPESKNGTPAGRGVRGAESGVRKGK